MQESVKSIQEDIWIHNGLQYLRIIYTEKSEETMFYIYVLFN